MKQVSLPRFSAIFVLVLTVFSANLQARTCTAIVNGGAWSNPATWSCSSVPSSNDTLWIPLGMTVSVDINSPTYSNMLIVVDGNLNFENGQKINLACGSSLYLSPTGYLLGGTPGSKINVCGTTVWNGPGPTGGPLSFGSPVLPIELLGFQAEVVNSTAVAFTWTTAKEVNNDYFSIERSTDGFTFEEILRVDGSGTTNGNKLYTATDINPVNGTSYYRLRQTDFNGQSETFNILAVTVSKPMTGCALKVSPNPCVSACTISLDGCTGETADVITLSILDAVGQELFAVIPDRDSRGAFSVDLAVAGFLKPGVYFVRGVSKKEMYVQKLIVN